MHGVLLVALLLAVTAATHGGVRLTPGVIQIAGLGFGFLGVLAKLIVQAKRRQAPEDTLANYAAHRLEELEDENASLRGRIEGLEAQVANLTARLSGVA